MEVNRFANVLKKQGIKKGDRVTISFRWSLNSR